jgi:chromosome partitioning protein
MGDVIAITSQKGGVGKTTTAINLGTSLAILEKKVLIIDFDPQGSVSAGFQLDEFGLQYGVYDAFVKKVPLAMAIYDVGLHNLEIVPANVKNEEDEIDLFTNALQPDLLKRILGQYKEMYDFIIIDCPPSLGTITINALSAADAILIPIQCEYYALKALGKFIRSLKSIGTRHNRKLRLLGILITMFDKRLKNSQLIEEELRRGFRNIIFETKIPRNAKVAESPGLGKPVALMDVTSAGAVGYLRLAEEVLKRMHNHLFK